MIAGTSVALATPAAPTCTVRTAGSNETALNTSITSVKVAATNYFGTTAVSSGTNVTVASGQVVDVTIAPSAGAMGYTIYGLVSSTAYVLATGVGGAKYTLQGFATLPSSVTAPAADTGTGKGTRMEGVIPTLTGASASAGVYPSGWQGGYVNSSVGTHLSYNAIYTALDALWESNVTSPGAFKADPQEIVGDGGDIMRLSNDVISAGTATNYRLFLEQQEVGGMRVGGAVSEFQNPITRSILKLVVHPWFTQGTAAFMTYQPPMTYSQVSNAWEMRCVQDYSSIAWPVIDATFRFSIFLYGALIASAPMYSGILQGLQVSDVTPYS